MSDRPDLAPKVDSWSGLRKFTEARIALGSVGSSLPTSEALNFSLAHARARDSVHLPFDADALAASLEAAGFATLRARSRAASRTEYLARPDLGRQLDAASVPSLTISDPSPAHRLTVVVADGLSALAPTRHALPVLLELRARLAEWSFDAIILATQARVALADQIGHLRHAEAVLMLLGERPGLSSPDSLGIYLTYAPRPGLSDAARNCVSNVRHGGLSYADAASRVDQLLSRSQIAGKSGFSIKDISDGADLTSALR